jgi:hypothetical protein
MRRKRNTNIFGGKCHSFLFFILQIGIETSTFLRTVILLGGCNLHGGVDVRWSGGLLFWCCIDVIVVRVKVTRELCHFPQWESTDSADTSQSANGEICMDKSHLLPNNPAWQ